MSRAPIPVRVKSAARPCYDACVFTGIVERSLQVLSNDVTPTGRRIVLPNHWPDAKHGESIAVNGCCLTIAELSPDRLMFDVIPESLDKTNLGLLNVGDHVHVERALKLGDRLDGHMVQGHVDGTAKIVKHTESADGWRTTVKSPAWLAKHLIPKGSVTLDGVSLTIAAIHDQAFEVALIPTTLDITQLGKRPAGWPLNVECDMMVKTIVSVIERQQSLNRTLPRDRL